ncbi:6-phosphofructokinase [Nocardioides sp. YR527]|uniref:1-phosphofructokinase family hexose kinase n=1 Tax=Nocardioides sp. YR527 TaxID=1881028 RepID=UPI00088E1971|nr:1-phosphofructokinase family hexose kinase [Nocardioides sp. YR527]SDK53477.1 6-phosphofructokinase [Nocardioides sp. YR527]
MLASSDVVTITLNPALDDSFSVPRLIPGNKMRCSSPRIDPGGGGINVARVLHVLGIPTLAVLPMAGHIGRALSELLEIERLPFAGVEVPGETRLSHHVTELETGLEYRFVLPGTALSRTDLDRCLQVVRREGRHAAYVVLSGSLPPGVSADVVPRVRCLSDALGARLVVDASGGALAQAHGAYLIKPSVRELAEHLGRDLDTIAEQVAGARQLLGATGANVVVLSRGHLGVALVTPTGTQLLPAVAGDLVSGVGAGDALVAGIIAGLTHGWDLARAARLGLACSAAMIATAGTSMFSRDDLTAFTDVLPDQIVGGRPARLDAV